MYEHGWEKMICQSDRAIGRFIGAEQEICPTKTAKEISPERVRNNAEHLPHGTLSFAKLLASNHYYVAPDFRSRPY